MIGGRLGASAKWILIPSAFWFAFILSFGSRHATLSRGWADELSHLYTSWIFWDHGLDIFRQPTNRFLTPLTDESQRQSLAHALEMPATSIVGYQRPGQTRPEPAFIAWAQVPRPYPPGVYLYFSPFSYIMSLGWMGPSATTFLVAAIGLIVAHLGLFFFYRELARLAGTRAEKSLIALIGFFAYCEAIRWTLNSEYDMLAIGCLFAFVILARRARPLASLCAFALALFLHLRSLMFLPLALAQLAVWLRHPRATIAALKPRHWVVISTALATSVLAVQTLVWNTPYFRMAELYDLNSMHLSRLLESDNLQRTLPFLAGYCAILAFWLRERLWTAAACSAWTVYMLVQSRLMREWYALFLLPFFLLALPRDGGPNKLRNSLIAALGFYTVFAAIFMNNSPFEFRLFREMVGAIQATLG